jgi:protein AaeX
MIAEVNVWGVFFSGALTAACLAGMCLVVVRRALARIGFYRLVWHRHLVDLALFTLLWVVVANTMPLLASALGRVG